MTTEQYVTFQKFNDEFAAMELGDLLKQENIDFILEDTSLNFDPSFSNNQLTKEYRIKLKKENFETANKLLTQLSVAQLDSVEKDYYLFDFTDEELIEIVTKPDEWNQFDYTLSQKILKDRGKEIKPEVAETIKKQRLQELAKPEESQRSWIIGGYIFSLLGGLLGVFIGSHLRYHKKTLPNGDRVYAYSTADRESGFNIFVIGIVCFILWSTVRILTWHN
ncbi:MAG: hypothetical protein K8R85_07825 [Bacteroidetes bacterium]|nr:hypothetical protein [Bacteroidota bacterium]